MITITAQVDSEFEGTLLNMVEIAGVEEESDTGNNTHEVITQVVAGVIRVFLPIIIK